MGSLYGTWKTSPYLKTFLEVKLSNSADRYQKKESTETKRKEAEQKREERRRERKIKAKRDDKNFIQRFFALFGIDT